MQLTSQVVLGRWLIDVLGAAGGQARKQDVLRRIAEKYGYLLTADDWLPQPSQQEPKWQNQTAWERNRLVNDGLLEPVSRAGRGVWMLTEAGWQRYREIVVR